MNFKINNFKDLLPLAVFFILASIYFAPLYSGKILVQSDNVQLTGVNKEISDFRENGEQVFWNSREFSGRPVLASSDYNPFGVFNRTIINGGIIPKAVMMLFLLIVGMYILLRVFRVSHWLSAIGAISYAFASFNIISIEVGHDNKVLAMAFMAPVLAGVILAYRGEILKGAVLTMIASGFQLYYGHIQITYYLLLMVLGYLVLVVIDTVKAKSYKQFMIASGALVIATLIGVGCNFTKLYSTLEYADYSNRGGTELNQGDNGQVNQSGLDKEYALSWSSGKMETFTLIFPYLYGGASIGELDENSETYQYLLKRNVPKQSIDGFVKNVPLYWGDQPFTGGPIYFGAIACFLFILSFFIIEDKIKWWALGMTALSILLAMGKNLEWFTDLFFYYFPLYNKFRSVTMILSIAQLIVPLMGFVALDKILSQDEKISPRIFTVLKVAGGVALFGLVLVFAKQTLFDFEGLNDKSYRLPEDVLAIITKDRMNLYDWSIYRSIIFIGLAAAAMFAYLKKMVKPHLIIAGLALIVLIDLWSVDKVYLGKDDFAPKRKVSEQQFKPSPADIEILKDKDYYRVMNLSAQNPFSDGLTSYHHYSILGYNAIKMQRYQELIDQYIRQMDEGVLDMLNTRYLIGQGQYGPIAQRRSTACGNAWLVKGLMTAGSPDEEIAGLESLDFKNEAIIDRQFGIEGTYSGNGKIELESYHPENLKYSFSSTEDQFAVFSEIYYAPGWNAYIDGKKSQHVRVDYVLRGMEIPSGNHEVEFKYEPVSLVVGNYLIGISTLLLIIFMAVLVFKNKKPLQL